MRILGIDPGLHLTGYGCIQLDVPEQDRLGVAQPGCQTMPRMVEAGVFRLNRSQSIAQRLVELDDHLNHVLRDLNPQRIVIEKLYSHYRHARTSILMAHARGVVLLAGQQHGCTVAELAATEVKKAVTGNGHASKEQVQHAIMLQCGLAEPPSPPDVADALAIALCDARRLATERITRSTS